MFRYDIEASTTYQVHSQWCHSYRNHKTGLVRIGVKKDLPYFCHTNRKNRPKMTQTGKFALNEKRGLVSPKPLNRSTFSMVPEGGIEPPRAQGPEDFESSASTSFTTPARLCTKHKKGSICCQQNNRHTSLTPLKPASDELKKNKDSKWFPLEIRRGKGHEGNHAAQMW